MRLYQHIKNEAVVKKTDADSLLMQNAPVFLWNPKVGLLWGVRDKNVKKGSKWDIYRNNKMIFSLESLGPRNFLSHVELLALADRKVNIPLGTYINHFIRGRINPNEREIYIHDIDSRIYDPMVAKRLDKYIDKTVNAIYKYMGDYIK